MKANKLFRKLALSGVALGAAAVTLTATTFAWYTSNTEADVEKVTAQTEAKSSASLFISTATLYDEDAKKTEGAYKQATTWADYLATATPHLTAGSTYTLKPVYSNAGTIKAATTTPSAAAVEGRAYNKIAGFTNSGTGTEITSTANYADEEVNDFVEFVLRVRSSGVLAADTKLYFSQFTLTPAAIDSSISTAQVPLATGGKTGITDKNVYSADLLNALKLDITSAPVTLGTDSAIPDAGATSRTKIGSQEAAATPATYGFQNQGQHSNNMSVNDSTGNAIGYYNTVMGSNFALTGPSGYVKGTEATYIDITDTNASTSGYTALEVATLPKTKDGDDFSVVEIRFVLYLDGWDNYCYDIMQGQKVDFKFELTTKSEKAVMYTGTGAGA